MRAAFDFVKLKNISRAADTRIPLYPLTRREPCKNNYSTFPSVNKGNYTSKQARESQYGRNSVK